MTLSELLIKLEILNVKDKIVTVDGNSPNIVTGDVSSNAQIFKEELQNEINDLKNTIENSDNLTQNNFLVGGETNIKEEKTSQQVYELLNIDNNIDSKISQQLNDFNVTVTSDIQTSKNIILGGADSQYDTLKKLQDLIIAIQTVLNSDDSTLDSIQELVDYIKNNKSTLDLLSVSSIIGLQTALDSKVDNVVGKYLTDNNLTDDLKLKLENSDNLTQNNFLVGGATNIKEEKSISEVYNLLNIDNNILTKMNEVLGNFQIGVTSDIEASKNSILGGASSNYNTLKKIEDLIIAIQTVLNSDDFTLDSIQEIVNYIKNNKSTLDSLGISSIIGLQPALDTKVDKVAGKGLSQNDLTNALLSQFLLYETTKVDKVADKVLTDNNLTDALLSQFLLYETTKVDKVANKVLSDNNLTNDLKNTIESSTQQNVIYDMNDVNSPAPTGLTGGSDILLTFNQNVKYLKIVFVAFFAGASGDQIVYEIHKTNNTYDSGIGYGHGVSQVIDSTYSSEHFSSEKTYSRSVARWSDNTFTHSHTGFISFPDGTQSSQRQFNTAYIIKKIIEVI